MQTPINPTERWQWPRHLMWALIALVFANAAWYTHVIANPMVGADNWLFVDTFLRHVIEGQATVGDFLVKRAGFDHGQPINKLLMLFHYRYFDLDFAVEAMIGILFAMLGFIVLYRLVTYETAPAQRDLAFGLSIAAAAAVYVSLNTAMIFAFSLVTLGYVDYLFAFLTFYTGWIALQQGRWWPLAVAMLVYGIAGDKSATLAGVVLAAALIFFGWRLGRTKRALALVVIIVSALAVAAWIYATFGEIRGETQVAFNVPAAQRISGLLAQAGDAWKWVIIPAASGIAYLQTLQFFFGGHWQAAEIVLGLLVVAGHLWFWWTAFRLPPKAASFAAICLMLLFYAYIAGLLYGRVFLRGAEYLDQPRYVQVYELGIVALLLMAAAKALERPATAMRRWPVVAVAVSLIVVQVPLTRDAYVEAGYIPDYYRRMAVQYAAVARDPTVDRVCVDMLSICGMTAAERAATMGLLRRHHLNLFSPKFRAAHPELATAAGPLPQ